MTKKNNKKDKSIIDFSKIKLNPATFGAIFMLALMVFAVVGFVYVGNRSSAGENTNIQEIPLQEFEQNGVKFWGAIRGGEQFIFENITGFDDNLKLRELSDNLKKQDSAINVIYSDGFALDGIFLIQKAFKGVGIDYLIQEAVPQNETINCNTGDFVLTYDESKVSGDCNKLISNKENGFVDSENLVYFLIQ